MPKFICLTDETTNRPVWVNPDHIVTMEEIEDESGRYTCIRVVGDFGKIDVRNTVQEIRSQMRLVSEAK